MRRGWVLPAGPGTHSSGSAMARDTRTPVRYSCWSRAWSSRASSSEAIGSRTIANCSAAMRGMTDNLRPSAYGATAPSESTTPTTISSVFDCRRPATSSRNSGQLKRTMRRTAPGAGATGPDTSPGASRRMATRARSWVRTGIGNPAATTPTMPQPAARATMVVITEARLPTMAIAAVMSYRCSPRSTAAAVVHGMAMPRPMAISAVVAVVRAAASSGTRNRPGMIGASDQADDRDDRRPTAHTSGRRRRSSGGPSPGRHGP